MIEAGISPEVFANFYTQITFGCNQKIPLDPRRFSENTQEHI